MTEQGGELLPAFLGRSRLGARAMVQFAVSGRAVCLRRRVLYPLDEPQLKTILTIAYLANAGDASRFGWERHDWHLDEAYCRGCVTGRSESAEVVVEMMADSAVGRIKSAGGAALGPIMLVESVFQSAVLISRVFRELNLLDHLVISMDCESALARLRHNGAGKPRLILLDLDMPRMSAAGFLKVVKQDRELQMVPVVVLADSHDVEKVSTFYGLGAAGYMVKSGDYTDILEKMRALCAYWTLSRFPMMY